METDLIAIAGRFQLQGTVKAAFAYGSGHINDSYKVVANGRSYLLQRINHEVFSDIYGLTSNLVAICRFLSEKIIEVGETRMLVLNPKLTNQGDYILPDNNGNYWRTFDFIEGSRCFDRAETPEIAFEGGRTFGLFNKLLKDFPAEDLAETIPGFHSFSHRLQQFEAAVKNDQARRMKGVTQEISFIEQRMDEMKKIEALGKAGKIPVRVTHNDTKISNVLFDENIKGICVIDLDTVMPGCILYDFGDAIRTFTNKADEDEKDLTRVAMDMELFEAFTQGFLSETHELLTDKEIDHLVLSARYITYEQSLRFLNDFINGDTYYKTHYPDHNLVRTRVQMRLLESMEAQTEKMEDIVRKCLSDLRR